MNELETELMASNENNETEPTNLEILVESPRAVRSALFGCSLPATFIVGTAPLLYYYNNYKIALAVGVFGTFLVLANQCSYIWSIKYERNFNDEIAQDEEINYIEPKS